MKMPNITPGDWRFEYDAIWGGKRGIYMLLDLDDGNHTRTEDAVMMTAAPDMFHALNCILAEVRGRGIHLDNATLALAAMVKAGGVL